MYRVGIVSNQIQHIFALSRGFQVEPDISKKAQRIKGLKWPYISQKAIKLLKCIIMIIWPYSGPHFNPKAI